MTLIGTWLATVQSTRATVGSTPYNPSSTYQSIWSFLRRASGGDAVYIGAAPAIMHMATPSVWPICYYPEWVGMSYRGLLSNAPDRLSWLLTKWSLEFLPLRPINELPLTLPCAIVYTDMFSNQSTSCKPIEIWPNWPNVGPVVPMAAFRPIYSPNLGLPTRDAIQLFDETMAGIVAARERDSSPVPLQMSQDNPYLRVGIDHDEDEEDEDYDEDIFEEGPEPDHELPEGW